MTTSDGIQHNSSMAPTAPTERIAALDVVRGFALIGILLMNIEFFNRYSGDVGMGVDPGLSGTNLWFSYFVQYFVTGKFWTIFSLLFGMGFAVMLMRAEAAKRTFLVPYLRRIVALAIFGALHHILLWNGDILFSYAAGAAGLLIALYGRLKFILLGIAVFIGLGFVPGLEGCFGVAGTIAFYGLLAWYLRCADRISLGKRSVPIFKIVVGFLMIGATAAILIGLFVPGLPREAQVVAPIIGSLVLVLSLLMVRYHPQVANRPWHMGVALYTLSMLMVTAIGAVQYYLPSPDAALIRQAPPAVSAPAAAKPAVAAPLKAGDAKAQADAKRIAEKRKKRNEALAEAKADKDKEVRVLTKGSYREVIAFRAALFVERLPENIGGGTQVLTLFLIGLWFVRSGIMSNTRAHRPLFKKLALLGLPIGIGLGLAGANVATYGAHGLQNGFQFASGLLMVGNLAASLGYFALVVLLLNSGTVFSRIAVLAPYGRMALTNYLTHSLVFSTIFFGYGLGYFGVERIWQLACVCAMVLVQVPLSHLWLSHFRYGPMEWLWRAITYWQIPAMRNAPANQASALQAA